jgi:hypothetical protein
MIVLATENGLAFCERDNNWRVVRHGLGGQRVTSVVGPPHFGGVVHEGLILAGTTDGVYRSEDEGQTWAEASACPINTGYTCPINTGYIYVGWHTTPR